jgi:hypothetical protein
MVKYLVMVSMVLGFSVAQAGGNIKDLKKRKVASAITDSDVKEKAKQFEMGCVEGTNTNVEKISHKFRYSYEQPTDQEHETIFYIASCLSGAYNTSSIIFHDDPYSGLVVVPLSSPLFSEKTLKIIGWISEMVVGGITYDAKKNTLVSFSKGRGVGDMSNSATYSILENFIVLRKYEFDGSGDGKINPKVVFESKEPLKR